MAVTAVQVTFYGDKRENKTRQTGHPSPLLLLLLLLLLHASMNIVGARYHRIAFFIVYLFM